MNHQRTNQLAEGCHSACTPCSHQKVSPTTLCAICSPPLKAVTIVVPSGYRDAAEFLQDCEFEEATSVIDDLAMMLRRMIWMAEKQTGDSSMKALAGNAKQLLAKYDLEGSPLREGESHDRR